MDPTLLPETDHLTARGADDLLGYVGHVLGTLPDRGLVIVTLAGGVLRAVVRVDLPEDATDPGSPPRPPLDADDVGAWADAVARVPRRDAAADACVAAVLDPSARADPPGWWPALAVALAARGIPPRGSWRTDGRRAWPLVAPWEPPAVDAGTPRPVDPRVSTVSLELVARGSVWGLRDDDLLVPERPRSAAAAELADPVSPDPRDRAARARWLATWETVLDGSAAVDDAAAAGELAGGLEVPAWRDGLVLTAALPAGAPLPPPAERERLLTASTAEPPAWERLDRLRAACRELAGRVPDAPAAQALAVAAWVSWARGHGSAAGTHLDEAARLASQDPFVRVLRALVRSGAVAGWACDPRTAWRPASTPSRR